MVEIFISSSHLWIGYYFAKCPRFSKKTMRLIKNIGNYYLQEDYTYLRIYGVIASPHIFPKFVPNRLILSEISYQTILQGFNASLAKDARKITFIPYYIYLGHYVLVECKERKTRS